MSKLHSKLSGRLMRQSTLDECLSWRQKIQSSLHDFRFADSASAPPITLLYGSSVSGTAFSGGDADFCVVFPRNSATAFTVNDIQEVPREAQETVLSSLFHHMEQRFCVDVKKSSQRIYRSRIPIIHFDLRDSNKLSTSFDISLSLDGMRNSLLIREYVINNDRLRFGVLLVKLWGRQENILNARRGLLSPYALTIMYIFFMQKTGRLTRLCHEDNIQLSPFLTACASCDEASLFKALGPPDPATENDVREDLRDFFTFYSDEAAFDFDTDVVDIRASDPMEKKDAWLQRLESLSDEDKWHLLGHECLFIRDPFESHNLGRSVDFFKAEKIREVFRLADVDRLVKTIEETD